VNQKRLRQLAVLLFGVILVLGAVLVWALAGEGNLDAMAQATPQIPVEADDAAVAVALSELPRDVNINTVDAIRDRDDVAIIDVRTPQEFAAGRVPGSVNIPIDQLALRVDEIPTDRPVVLTCRSGRRSGNGVDLLEDDGFTNVSHMEGGMRAWWHADLDLELEP
jgi:rhodanese-related sulfurtransferase